MVKKTFVPESEKSEHEKWLDAELKKAWAEKAKRDRLTARVKAMNEEEVSELAAFVMQESCQLE